MPNLLIVFADGPPLVAIWVLRLVCLRMGSLIVLADRPPCVAICVFVGLFSECLMIRAWFLIVLADRTPLIAICVLRVCVSCYVHGFVDWFRRQPTISY